MNSYVYHMNCPMDRHADGTVMEGSAMVTGYYVYYTNDKNELFDIAGPFDDELDAELARLRAEEIAR